MSVYLILFVTFVLIGVSSSNLGDMDYSRSVGKRSDPYAEACPTRKRFKGPKSLESFELIRMRKLEGDWPKPRYTYDGGVLEVTRKS